MVSHKVKQKSLKKLPPIGWQFQIVNTIYFLILIFLAFDHLSAPTAFTLMYNFFLFLSFLLLIVTVAFLTVFLTRTFLNFLDVEICT